VILQIQYLLKGTVDIFLSLIRILLLSRFRIKFPEKKSGEIYVLGNGPSLKETLSDSLEKLTKAPVLGVNNFAFSDYFSKVRPSYYVISAPEYFMLKPPTQAHIDQRERLFDILVKQTGWEMTFFVPALAAKTQFWKDKLAENQNIKVAYFNNTPVEGPTWFINRLFSINLGMPRPHNVLVPSIFISVNMGYKRILLFGADHSWHEEIRVDENNNFSVNHEHFYDSGEKRGAMHKLSGEKYCLHDLLRKLHLAFKGYFVLKSYAEFKKSEVLNASKKSYIDAFPKIKF
jgi:hypothetical protein